MKKSLLVGIIMAAGLASSYAQGTIFFDTYNSNNEIGQVTLWGQNNLGITVGTPLGLGFTAGLVYSTIPISETAVPIGGPISPGWTLASITAPFAVPVSPATLGYFTDSTPFTLADYTPGSLVYFEVLAYNGSSYDTSTIRAHSASFSEILTTGMNQPSYMDNMQLFTVSTPEPSILTLAGLGLVTLAVARKNFRSVVLLRIAGYTKP